MQETVIAIIKEVLGAMGVSFTEITSETIADQLVFQIVSDETSRLVGMHGDTIHALDYIVKKIVEQRGVERTLFIVDAGEYQVSRIKELQVKAKIMAERARSFAYDVELAPMSAYERLIVHATLSDEPNVKTESQGEGRDRRIVIRYIANDSVETL